MGNDTYHILRFNSSLNCYVQIKTNFQNKLKIVEYAHRSSAYAYLKLLQERFPNDKFTITRNKRKCIICNCHRVINNFMGYCNNCNIKIRSKCEV